jgi:membrane protein implicated in regulation of membrane protease activity
MTPHFFIIWCAGTAVYLIISLILFLRGKIERDLLLLIILSAFSSWLGLIILGIASLREFLQEKKSERLKMQQKHTSFKK